MKIKKIENLWVAANKLRGAFEIIELYKVMLYGLLFKYLELKKDKFNSYDEKFSLGYLSLTYGKLVDSNGLLEYVSAVEKEFRIEERVLKESLNSAIEKADSENVRIIFEEVNSLDIEDEIEKTVNAWFEEEMVTKAWLETYWTHHYIKKVRKAKEADAAWKDCKKEWQGKFNSSCDYQAKKVTFANVIADAFSLGPLKKRYCIIKKDTVEESSKKRKSKKRDDADLNKAMKRFDYLYSSYKKGTHASTKLKMLKNIIAFLIWQEEHPIWQAKHSGKQQAVLIQKGRLFGWYGRDDSKGDKSAWLLDGFKWKDDRPIMSAESYGTFAKMSIDSNFISENGFKIIDTEEWEAYEEDYWILEDGGHGKKAFVIKNRPSAVK